MRRPAEDIVAVLVAAGLGVAGQTVFSGQPTDIAEAPPIEVFVFSSGGVQMPYMGSGDSLKSPRLRAQVRSRTYLAGELHANEIAALIDGHPSPGYAGWRADLPIPMPKDGLGRFRWSIPILVQYTE